jgi:predicted nucleotidyltransferase
MLPAILQSNIQAICDLCEQCDVIRLDAFGSVLRNDFAEESDVDFLVHFRRDGKIDAFSQYFDFKEGLEAILNRRVDLICEAAVRNIYFKRELEATRAPLYAA